MLPAVMVLSSRDGDATALVACCGGLIACHVGRSLNTPPRVGQGAIWRPLVPLNNGLHALLASKLW